MLQGAPFCAAEHLQVRRWLRRRLMLNPFGPWHSALPHAATQHLIPSRAKLLWRVAFQQQADGPAACQSGDAETLYP